MPIKTTVIGLSTVLAVTAGCALFSPEQQPLSHAAAMLQCGPADDGFTRIVLSHEPVSGQEAAFPNVQIVIVQSPLEPGRTYDVTSDVSADAWYLTGPGRAQSAIAGSVTIASVDSTYTIEGSVQLRFPSRVVATTFTAPWINTGTLCG